MAKVKIFTYYSCASFFIYACGGDIPRNVDIKPFNVRSKTSGTERSIYDYLNDSSMEWSFSSI